MTIIALAFRDYGKCPESWTPETCDMIRSRMMRDIPGPVRASAARWPKPKPNEVSLDDLMPAVHVMRQQGAPWMIIAKALKRDVTRLRNAYCVWVTAHA